jgi:hypothetical protein
MGRAKMVKYSRQPPKKGLQVLPLPPRRLVQMVAFLEKEIVVKQVRSERKLAIE